VNGIVGVICNEQRQDELSLQMFTLPSREKYRAGWYNLSSWEVKDVN